MHNEVKSEETFAVTSAKRIAVFQISSKIAREEAGDQPSNKDNKHSTSHGIKDLPEGGYCKEESTHQCQYDRMITSFTMMM